MKKDTTRGRDLEAFRAAHDKAFIVPQKVRQGLASLGDSWMYEADFVKHCGVATQDFAAYRDQFLDFSVEVGGGTRAKRVWAGTKGFAAKLRAAVQ